ncbi:MAG: ABC transporter permease [Planctomycetes bacterium]|nr:ABC transporter permease [Planctomycetota bacterium]
MPTSKTPNSPSGSLLWLSDKVINRVVSLGSRCIILVSHVGHMSLLLAQVIKMLISNRPRREVMVRQLYHIGYLSLPVVLLTGVCIGLVLAVQAYATLSGLNGENMAGAMVNFSLVTQIIPVLVGLTLAGRVGASIAAELGTMQVTEQIDALRVMGTDPIQYLIVPRFFACVALMPFLTALSSFVGIMAAAELLTGLWGIDKAAYWAHASEFVDSWDILIGLAKTVVYGAIIALISCRNGLMTTGGATGVGDACTKAVVDSSMVIMVASFILTLISQELYDILLGA